MLAYFMQFYSQIKFHSSPNGCKVFDLLFLITLGSLQRTAGPHAWNCAQPFVRLPLQGIAGMRCFQALQLGSSNDLVENPKTEDKP